MNTFAYDVRTAARRLLDVFLVALAALGLVVGIGASAAFVSAVLASERPLFEPDVESRLVEVAPAAPANCPTLMSSPDFLDYQAATAADACSRS